MSIGNMARRFEKDTARGHLYACDVPELQQRVLDNLFSDLFLSIVLLAILVSALYHLARFWKASVLPLLVLLPYFVVAGLVISAPLSPFYVRSDGEFYQNWGLSLASAWLTGEPMVSPRALWPGKGLWPLIIGVFASIAGPVTITLIVFNALILVLTAILLQKATMLFGGKSPRWSMVIVYVSSSPFVLWGPSLLREALFWLGVALGVLAVSYFSLNRYRSALLSLCLSGLILLGIRPDAGVVLFYGFVATLAFLWGVERRRSLFRALGSVLIVSALVLTLPGAVGLARGGKVTSGATVVISAEDLREANTAFVSLSDPSTTSTTSATSATSDSSWCESESLITAGLCSALENLPHAFFGPFHWEYQQSVVWFIAGASTMHFLVLLVLAAYSVFRLKGRRLPLMALLAVAAASMLMFASILTNYGILIRFRAATEIMLIPLALLGASALRSKAQPPGRNRFSFSPPGRI